MCTLQMYGLAVLAVLSVLAVLAVLVVSAVLAVLDSCSSQLGVAVALEMVGSSPPRCRRGARNGCDSLPWSRSGVRNGSAIPTRPPTT